MREPSVEDWKSELTWRAGRQRANVIRLVLYVAAIGLSIGLVNSGFGKAGVAALLIAAILTNAVLHRGQRC